MKSKNLFWGLFFIGVAVVIVLNGMGILANINIFTLVLTLLMLPIIFVSCVHVNFPGILFPMAILAIVYADPLGITNLTPWPVLITALFGSIGFSLVFHKKRCYNFHHFHDHKSDNDEHFSEIIDSPDSDTIDFNVSFSSAIKYVNSDDFKQAKLSCKFGALKVYFDNAKITGDEAQIYLEGSFSGIELYIPKTWKLVNKIDVTLSGVEEKNRSADVLGPTVTILGNLNFSGVEIIYV